MSKFSKIILFAVAIAVLSWFLPWLYALLTPSPAGEPFCSLSPLNGQWIVSRSKPGEKPSITLCQPFATAQETLDGEKLTVAMRDSLAPQLYYRQLVAHDNLPDTIAGKETTVHTLRSHELFFNGSPREVNKRNSGMWLMMESMPPRVDLSDPEEAFRFTDDGIKFVKIADNTVNSTRSRRFTDVMKSRGFSFPATDLSANVTSQKGYDEGYLMIDSDDKLFHIKQRGGRPFVAAVSLPEGKKASKAFIWEESDKSLLGLVIDTEGHPYVIEAEGHIARPLPAEAGTVDPRKESIMAMGNLFNLTFRFTGADGTRWRSFDSDSLELIGALDFPRVKPVSAEIAQYIFPYTLSFVSAFDSLAYPRLSNLSFKALPLNILFSLILLFIGIRRKDATMKWGALVTVPFGIFSFVPFMLFHE